MTQEIERLQRELLSLATEDWYFLAEGLSAVQRSIADGTFPHRETAGRAIQSLLERGWIRLARLNFTTNEESDIAKGQEAQVLQHDESWASPNDRNPWAVVFAATEAGEREYTGGDS